jgi:hypothetical protein
MIDNSKKVKKSIIISNPNEKWLKEKSKELGISESDIFRRLIDKEISENTI